MRPSDSRQTYRADGELDNVNEGIIGMGRIE
jgi:hypothetical protein